MNLVAHPLYKQCITDELSRRIQNNPRYSLRAFAKALEIEPGTLSQLCSGKKTPSYGLALKLCKKLNFSPDEEQQFLLSIAQAKKDSGSKRTHPELKRLQKKALALEDTVNHSLSDSTPKITRELSVDTFTAISEWYHHAILELTLVPHFPKDAHQAAQWLATVLNITVTEAKLALERLETLELLQRDATSGRYFKTDAMTATADPQLTTAAHRKRQKQILKKSIHSLENDPIEKRNHTAVTMAGDPKKILEAKRKIDRFLDELCLFLESGDKDEVFELQVSLFQLSQISKMTAKKEEKGVSP